MRLKVLGEVRMRKFWRNEKVLGEVKMSSSGREAADLREKHELCSRLLERLDVMWEKRA